MPYSNYIKSLFSFPNVSQNTVTTTNAPTQPTQLC